MNQIFGISAVALLLAGCTTYPQEVSQGDFWQRISNTSALYMRGPQAQHQLHKDIADCVVEMRELERLGSIRDAVPADLRTPRSDRAAFDSETARFDSPNKDDINYTQYFDYADFEGCMRTAGWQRVEYVPYNVADTSREVYIDTIIDQFDRKRGETRRTLRGEYHDSPSNDDFDNLNE